VEPGPEERKIDAALREVRDGSRQVRYGRRKDELVRARHARDRAILKALKVASVRRVAEAAGLSVTRVKQISAQHPPGPVARRR
jgi:uncharacterized protein YggE